LERIKIAYVSVNDPLDKRSWSGITYYLGKALERNIGEVDYLGPVKVPRIIDLSLRALAKGMRILTGKEYSYKYSWLRARYSSYVLNKRLSGKKYDCIVAPASSDGVAFLKTDIPIVYMADTTYALISGYYTWEFKNVSGISLREGNMLERRSLGKTAVAIYASNWAANSAIKDYGFPKENTFVVIMGANTDHIPGREVIMQKKDNPVLTMLFLAVDWDRKGGPLAFEALKHLTAKGVKAKLIVCGCIPPTEFSHPDMEVIPFLNKNLKEDHDKFVHLLKTSHFLILPTRADCSLLVACESNAYGMPAIATATGGVPDVVLNGINGYTLPYEAKGAAYGDLIAEIYDDKERYEKLIESSRTRFENVLNWDKWTEQFGEIYTNKIAKGAR
jgi:glycosyltransferase involved in cell wall biosynthesis